MGALANIGHPPLKITIPPPPPTPGWVRCELCESSVTHMRPRLVPAFARNARAAETDRGMLVLLCPDCCALIVGEIDEKEWGKRLIRRGS